MKSNGVIMWVRFSDDKSFSSLPISSFICEHVQNEILCPIAVNALF